MKKNRPSLYLIDGSSYLYRAFYGLTRLTNARGMPTQAVFGFDNMLRKVLRDRSPDFVCVVFDPPGPTQRSLIYDQYKANRQKMPEDLAVQIPYIKRLVDSHGISRLELDGFEADDLIATLVRRAWEEDLEVVIVSGDKDLHQLVRDPLVSQWDPQRDRTFGEEGVRERFGITPEQMVDYLALVGDSTDNIPGVKGIGEKTARQLLQTWGSLDELYRQLDAVTPPAVAGKLRSGRDQAYLSRRLVVLDLDVPVPWNLHDLAPKGTNYADLRALYEELDFRKHLESLPPPEEVKPGEAGSRASDEQVTVRVISDEAGLAELETVLSGKASIAVAAVGTSGEPMRAALTGIGVCVDGGSAYYVPWPTREGGTSRHLTQDRIAAALKPALSNPEVGKLGHDLKADRILLTRHGMALDGLAFDTLVADYLLQAGQGTHELRRLAEEHLGVALQDAAVGGKLSTVWRLVPVMRQALETLRQDQLFETLEMPLVEILAAMELRGILVDAGRLETLAVELERRMGEVSAAVYELAKEEFNIQSPKQLAAILFDKLGLPVVKRTKSGPSTDVRVLEELAGVHPIAEKILSYRTLAKLKGTYADALPHLIHPETGRIHSSFNQTVTATGRLSSSNPNLQNIPIRSEEGRKIREAFVAAPRHVLFSADYSQIELRILAAYSGDEHLLEAFRNGLDVHAMTAAEIYGISPDDVTQEMRRQAKTINFGIIYGMGPFGLAQRLGIGRQTAKALIDRYFDRYDGVKRFIDHAIETARKLGYTETLLGRRRAVPELKSRNATIRQQGERLSINSPIQGTAADLIKKAMIDVHRALLGHGLKSAMLLQVHDELVFEVPEGELGVAKEVIQTTMEAVWDLAVPLVVEVGYGENWAEAHP